MKSFKYKFILFLSPVILNALVMFVVDPYNYFNASNVIPDEVKVECLKRTLGVMPRANILYKTLEYKKKPVENIIIGDSRMYDLNMDLVNSLSEDPFYNFSVPGGILLTEIDLFWFAAKHCKLKKVYMQIGFLNYNKSADYDLFSSYTDLMKAPIEYFYQKEYIMDSYSNLYFHFTGDSNFVDPDYRHRDEDPWARSQELMDIRVEHYAYPERQHEQLQELAEYCKKNDVELIFVIVPNYIEFLEALKENNLDSEFERFRSDLEELGNVLDLSDKFGATDNKELFHDHFHFDQSISDSITYYLWQ